MDVRRAQRGAKRVRPCAPAQKSARNIPDGEQGDRDLERWSGSSARNRSFDRTALKPHRSG
jgi:hypothetical protein